MGCTYSRLGAMFGSPKLRLLSHFRLLSPLYSPSTQRSYLLTCPFSPACCCVPRLSQLLRDLPHRYRSPLCSLRHQDAVPLSENDLAVPVYPQLDNACNSRCTLARDFYLGGDIRRNFLKSFYDD